MSDLQIRMGQPPAKLAFLYNEDVMNSYEYFILKGGRGGGKTETLGQYFIVNSMHDGSDILCLREIQNSIGDSVYKVLVEWIDILGLNEYFHVLKTEIINKQSKARFSFKGMKGNDSIKSTKGIRYVWYEEAQTATRSGWDILNPTIRIDGRRIFFSMNPETDEDVIPAVVGISPKAMTVHINFSDNPYCPQTLIDQAEECRLFFPEDYDHIWLGKPRGDGDRQTVASQSLLMECVDAHLELGHTGGYCYGGLDLAAGELKKNDKNALTCVQGPVITLSEEWRSGDLDAVARHVVDVGTHMNLTRLYYDAVGVGGFAEKTLLSHSPKFGVVPFMGQHSVHGPKKKFIRSRDSKMTISNKDFFKNLKAQMWWNIRLRAENTVRMKRGFQTPRPEYYLSFDSTTVDKLDTLIREISQATWKEDESGRIVITKTPADYNIIQDGKTVKMRSPNRADSAGAALLRSCKYGLKANR